MLYTHKFFHLPTTVGVPGLLQKGFQANPHLVSELRESWVALLCQPQRVRLVWGRFLGPCLVLMPVLQQQWKLGEGLGSFKSATPSVNKQLSASRSIGCGSKLMLPLASRCGVLSLEFLCPWVGQTQGRGCH